MHLIAFSLLDPDDLLGVLKVAIGLGLVIFVHELGHFVVAKACGVKCEKFYLGFDIFGLKLFKFRWGETEYGIGALPLGGYVKMLGQEDNPAKVRDEMERAKLHMAAAQQSGDAAEVAATAAVEAEAEAALYDPRSYLAKSVPKRMAIISAGVVMNVIFAVVFATVAYLHGVNEVPCDVGGLIPGRAAWKAGLEPGDRIVKIGDVSNPRFKDLRSRVTLGDNLDEGVEFTVERPIAGQPERTETKHFMLIPDRDGSLAPMIGIEGAYTTTLNKHPFTPDKLPIDEWAYDQAIRKQFAAGDQVLKIDDASVHSGADVKRMLASHLGSLRLTILRTDKEKENAPAEQLLAELPARPMKTLGLVMDIGPVKAIQAGSPADKAGIQVGDLLVKVDGQPVGDPLFLPEQLRRLAGKSVTLSVERSGKSLDLQLTPREPLEVEEPMGPGMPQTAPAIGIAYVVRNRIHEVTPGGPAAESNLTAGQRIKKVALVPPQKPRKWYQVFGGRKSIDFDLDDEKQNWQVAFAVLQHLQPGTKVEVTLDGEDEPQTLEPRESAEWLNPDRGLEFEPMYTFQRADSLGQAVALGANEAIESVAQVYRFLRKIGTQVSPKGVAGPIEIAKAAHRSATQGVSDLLIFLTMLSANLAVINFLPIPLLDGGHMVFLIYEGIRGKPASERIILTFHYAGFLFILSLMAFVFMLDLGIISRFGN